MIILLNGTEKRVENSNLRIYSRKIFFNIPLMNSAKCRCVYTTYYCSYLETKNVLVTEKNYFI